MASALHQPLLLHINGADVPSASRNTFTVPDALTGKPLYECAAATIQDYDTAIQSAYSAHKSWSRTAPSIRRNILLRAADILTTYLDEIAPPILSGEVSAVPTWIKQNILGSAATLRESACLATNIKGEIVPSERPQTTILITREPVGVIFAIAPWNAPVCLLFVLSSFIFGGGLY
jgi:acyl-CoA reductase-like NAD-dependent aldehyde dehydrogenase